MYVREVYSTMWRPGEELVVVQEAAGFYYFTRWLYRDGEIYKTEAAGPFDSLDKALRSANRWLHRIYGRPFYSRSYIE